MAQNNNIKEFYKAEIEPLGSFGSEQEFTEFISDPKNATDFFEAEFKEKGIFGSSDEFFDFIGVKKKVTTEPLSSGGTSGASAVQSTESETGLFAPLQVPKMFAEKTLKVKETPAPKGKYTLEREGQKANLTRDDIFKNLDNEEFLKGVKSGEVKVDIQDDEALGNLLNEKLNFFKPKERYAIDGQEVSQQQMTEKLYDRDFVNKLQQDQVKLEFPETDTFIADLSKRQKEAGGQLGDKWDSFVSGLQSVASGVVGLQSYVDRSLKAIFGMEDVPSITSVGSRMMSEELSKKAEETSNKIRAYEGDFIDAIRNGNYLDATNMTFNAISGTLPIIGVGMATGGGIPALGIMSGVSASGELAGSDGMKKLSGEELTEAEKVGRATILGTAEGVLGYFPTTKIVGKNFNILKEGFRSSVNKATQVGGKEAGQKVAQGLASKTAPQLIKEYAIDNILEVGGETATGIITDLTDNNLGITDYSAEEIIDRAKNNAAQTVAVSGVFTSPSGYKAVKKTLDPYIKKNKEKVKKDIDDNPNIPKDQKEQAKQNIDKRVDAINAVPTDLQDNVDVVDLVQQKKELEEQAKNLDPIFQGQVQEKISELEAELIRLANEKTSIPTAEIKDLAQRIAKGEKIESAEDLQLQANYPSELETELKQLASGTATTPTVSEPIQQTETTAQEQGVKETVSESVSEVGDGTAETTITVLEPLSSVEATAKALEKLSAEEISKIKYPRKAIPTHEMIAVEHAGYEAPRRVTSANKNEIQIQGYGTTPTTSFLSRLIENGRLNRADFKKGLNIRLTGEYATKLLRENEDLFPSDLAEPKAIAEAYHKAKADGSNPELVKAVEELLTPKIEQDAKITTEQPSSQMREQSVQETTERTSDSNMPIVNEAELQDGKVVTEEGKEEVNEKEGNLVLPKKGEAIVKVGEVNAEFKDANKVMGEETTIEMPNGETREAQYMVVELDDIMASHNETSFGNTDGFPSYNGENANTRNYKGDDNAKARVEENAQKLKPSIVISDTATPDSGVPIISKDGIVVSGNGRAMSIKRAKKQYGDKYDAYKEALIKKAAKFGIDANKVSEMKNPILVKIDNSVTEYTPKVFDDYNKPLQKAEAPIDKAIKRSNIIRGNNTLKNKVLEIVGRYETMSDLFANKADTKLLIENLVSNEVILPQEVAEFVNKDGTLTDSGKDLVNDILIATVLNAETLRATENVKGFRNKLINSLPLLSANYGLGDYSLEQEINDAIKLQSDVAAWGNQEDFWKYINQLGVFDVVNPNTVIINRLINSGKNNFKDFVRIYNQTAGTDEMNLFGAGEVLTKQDIIDNLKKSKLNEDERKIIAGLEGIYDDAIAQRQERDAGVAKEKDKKQQLDEKQRELDNKIAEEKKKLDDLNKKGENLGFAFDPKAEAERQYNIHKTLVSIAKLYIQKGVTTAQQFANEVGLRLQDVSRAFEEALGKKTYSKDDITNSPYDTDYIRLAWQPTLPQQQNQIEIDANDAIANGAISFIDFNNAMSANAAYNSLPNSSKQIIYNNAVATYSNTQAINQANQNNQPNPTINLKEQTWLEKVKTAFQDRLTRLKDIQKQMELAGIQILDQANVALKYELLIGKSKAKIDEKYQQIVKSNNKNKPALFERLVKEGGDVDELGIYMYALHAQERNAAVAQMRQDEFNQAIIELTDKINNATTQSVKTRFQNELTALVQGKGKVKLLPDGGSGMTNQQANDIIDAVNQSGKRALYDRYAQDFRNEVINSALDQQLQYGLISQESYDLIKAKYQNYVPLQVVEKALEKRIGGGTGAGNVRGKDIYKSKGSDLYKYTDRYNPVVSSLFNYNNAIIRGEQNLVNKTLIELANLDTQNEVFEIHKPKYTPIVDANGNVQYLIPMLSDAIKNNSVETKVDGKPVFVEIKDKALLDAIRQNGVIRGWRGFYIINTWLRNTATIMNPEFIFTNFSRDFETALINIQSEMVDNNIKGLTRKIANPKNIFNAGRGILEDYKGNHNSIWAKAAKEYRDSGGQVSWFQKETLDEYVNDIENKIKSIKKGENIPVKVLNNLGETLFLTQSVVEQSLRLATFKTLRDAGVSAERAASAAKNITVNFETKGTWSGLVDSIYLFANAGIQGSYRMTKSLATSKKAQGAAAFLFTAGIFEAYLNDIFGGEDDDDEQISDKVKERNFVLVNPENSKDIYFKFPLAYGANVFKYAGNIVYDVANGRKTPIKGTTEILLSIYNQFSPIQGATISQALSPTFFDPIVQGVQNKNFMATPIKPEQVKYQPAKKESDLYFSSVRPISKDMATWLNENTGGTDIKAGYIDISPEYIDHYFDAFTGGTGRFIANVGTTTRSLVDDEQKYEIRNTPFVRSFVGEPREKRNLQFIYNTFDRSLKDVLTDEEMKKFEKELDLAVSTGSMQRDTAKKLLKQVKKHKGKLTKIILGKQGLESQ